MNGRKRHLLVDTLGLVLAAVVHPANLQDREGARQVLAQVPGRFPHLRTIWADRAYQGALELWAFLVGGWLLQIVRPVGPRQGFAVEPHRWIGERTFAWLGKYRRLSRDYEEHTQSSEAMIHVAMIHLMVRRLRRS